MENQADMFWPPAYELRYSKRARHAQLRICPRKGLEVVIPVRKPDFNITKFLNEKRDWVEHHLKDFSARDESLPSHIELRALEDTWKVEYAKAEGRVRALTRPGFQLVLTGDVEDEPSCKTILLNWVKRTAKKTLVTWFHDISRETGLAFTRVSIRGQQTRWGSCSSTGDITLNYKLLFLPPMLARHIMVHELCHTVHMNHSQRFWRLVASFDPDWREHRREARIAEHYVPGWVE